MVDGSLFVKYIANVKELASDSESTISLKVNTENVFKFFVSENINSVVFNFNNVLFCKSCTKMISRIRPNAIATIENNSKTIEIIPNLTEYKDSMWVAEEVWYYISFMFVANNLNSNDTGKFNLDINYISNRMDSPNSTLYKKAKYKSTMLLKSSSSLVYKQYDLIRDGNTESFLFSYELEILDPDSPLLFLNMSSTDFTALKFKLYDTIDVGGTLQLIVAFKPRITRIKGYKRLESEPANHVILACIGNKILVPTWPSSCVHNDGVITAPIILNNTKSNNSMLIPYPESGTWFVTMKLFCGNCKKCFCPEKCKKEITACTESCGFSCKSSEECKRCSNDCEQKIVKSMENCTKCDCDSSCKRNSDECNTSVLFDVSSTPCMRGKCGPNGHCVYMVAEGFVYSSCVCMNNYRGKCVYFKNLHSKRCFCIKTVQIERQKNVSTLEINILQFNCA